MYIIMLVLLIFVFFTRYSKDPGHVRCIFVISRTSFDPYWQTVAQWSTELMHILLSQVTDKDIRAQL